MNANDRSITGFAAVGHATFHLYELAIPVFVVAWLDDFGVSPAIMGLVVGLGYGLVGVGSLPAGILSDRVPARLLVLVSVLGMSGAFLTLSVAPNERVVAASLAVWGAAASIYHPAGLALLSRATAARGEAFALHGAAGNVGTVLGPLLAAVGLTLYDWRLVAAGFVVAPVIGVLVSSRFSFDVAAGDDREEAGPTASGLGTLQSDARALFTGGFVGVFVVVLLYGIYYRGVLTFLPDLLSALPSFAPVEFAGRTLEPYRYAYAGILTVGVLGQYVGGKLTERVRTERAIAGTFAALAALAVVFLPAADAGLAPLLVVGALLGFTLFVIQPLYQATVALYTPAGTRGLSYGYTYLGVFGVGAAGAALAGGILQYFSPPVLFAVLAALAVAGAVTAVALAVSAD
jgi:MFS family permease